MTTVKEAADRVESKIEELTKKNLGASVNEYFDEVKREDFPDEKESLLTYEYDVRGERFISEVMLFEQSNIIRIDVNIYSATSSEPPKSFTSLGIEEAANKIAQ